ncbi:MAG: hypothetical protein Q7Q71_12410 [Verrucomicrobiota bacterium JB023]|nr:hypothetical protein [Verrucomicrobiota bacterium JB023]
MTSDQPSIASHFLRDLADGIQQQMYFWGQDVIRPEGNFLLEQGFQKSPSTGLKGTSCYRREWRQGHVELYGSCAGWYGKQGGFTFIRPWKRCSVWLSGSETPIPGAWQKHLVDRKATRADLYQASLPFLEWLLSYEYAVLARFGRAYRKNTYWKYRKIPKTKAWLDPDLGLRWFQCYLTSPKQLVRPKNLARESAPSAL